MWTVGDAGHGRWHGRKVHVHLCAEAGQWGVASDGGTAML